ncbi:MAG: TonB-dependent receptor [Flavobacteriaceae bacterium]|nr:TonB-dependent receptor [Flavobacteriaceae bacterium]
MKKLTLMLTALLVSGFCYSQNILTGTIVDSEMGKGLPGATVLIKGTSNGVSSDFDGKFEITSDGPGALVVSFVGYLSQEIKFEESMDITVSLKVSGLSGITVFGTADFAMNRDQAVTVTTLTAADIQERIGNLELPEMLNATPGVYATKAGGAFGDSRINVRGFDSQNTAVMINGIPVNDMENGRVYWSNWSGLSDVVSAMQVQRGLGASKLAISSVGGTINVLTKSTELSEGGRIAAMVGNDGYGKTVASYNTGEMDGGHALSLLFSRTAGDGYVDGTMFEGYNYFLGYGWRDSSNKHNVQLIITGAPQTHHQRTGSFFNMALGAQYKQYGIRYNYNHGYLNGQEFNWRKNFYHKPLASINWEYNINETTDLSASVYYSIGRGGGTGDIGRAYGYQYASGDLNYNGGYAFRNPINGHVNYDKIYSYNSGVSTTFYQGKTAANSKDAATGLFIVNDQDERVNGVKRNGIVRRASVNSHNFVGSLINLKKKLNDKFSLDFGVDIRSYKGIHYRRLDNLLGADGYRDFDNKNYADKSINGKGSAVRTTEYSSNLGSLWNVFRDTDKEEKIDYHNDGLVRWTGAFTQLKYKHNNVAAFLQGAVSNQGFQRIEYFNQVGTATSSWKNITGGNVKAGVNYNFDIKSNVYVNGGYYSKQPNFDAVYINYSNTLNPDLKNETVTGMEAGYGYVSSKLRMNINVYKTTWEDRFLSDGVSVGGNRGTANYYGIKQIHSGFEFDGEYQISPFVTVQGMLSLGNYEYGSDVTADVFNTAREKIGTATLFLDGVKVGDAAQTTSRINLKVSPTDLFGFNVSMFSASELYANFNPEDFDTDGDMAMKIPAYELFNFGASYKLSIAKEKIYLRLNVNNLFDTHYIAESATNILASPGDPTWLGVNEKNRVFPGWGRTWNLGFTYRF